MRYDIFSQSTGTTLFTVRFEIVAQVITYWCRSLDYVTAGDGWIHLADVCVGYSSEE